MHFFKRKKDVECGESSAKEGEKDEPSSNRKKLKPYHKNCSKMGNYLRVGHSKLRAQIRATLKSLRVGKKVSFEPWSHHRLVPRLRENAPMLSEISGENTENIGAAFRGMHVPPAKHSYAWLPRKCDYRTDTHTHGQTDTGQSDPYVPLCFAGDTTRSTVKVNGKCAKDKCFSIYLAFAKDYQKQPWTRSKVKVTAWYNW